VSSVVPAFRSSFSIFPFHRLATSCRTTPFCQWRLIAHRLGIGHHRSHPPAIILKAARIFILQRNRRAKQIFFVFIRTIRG